MARDLILTTRDKQSDKRSVDAEIENIQRILPYLESFRAFLVTNDVFDMTKRTQIKKRSRLRSLYWKGIDKNPHILLYCKN